MLRDYVGDASGMRESTQDHATIPPWAPPPDQVPDQAAERTTDGPTGPADGPTAAPDPADATRAVPSVTEPTRVVAPVPPAIDTAIDTTGTPAQTRTDLPDEPVGDAGEPSRTGPVDQPTQAGMPVFDDERDEIGWVAARSDPPPPPPPFEERPAKPLFAPEPPEGQPARRPREGFSAATSGGYWPWEGTSGGQHTGSHTGPTRGRVALPSTTRAPATTTSRAAAGSGSPC